MGKMTGILRARVMAPLWIAILFSYGVALAQEGSPGSPVAMDNKSSMLSKTEGGSIFSIIQGIKERADAKTGKNWIETPDAVLIQQNNLEWSRYLKEALKLPDWVDLGIEHRIRGESIDHPIHARTSRESSTGQTDAQLPLRTRLRFGLGGDAPVRFLFEGEDARSYGNNSPGDQVDNTTVDEWDILQLLGSLTANNVLGSGLRTDLHFGRMTLDFGRRRLIARNDFRNTTNAFDGFHWQIAQGNTWRFRAFLTEPVIRHSESPDQQSKDSLFWGTYGESMHFPWFKMNAYYFGLNDLKSANANQHRTYSTYGVRVYKDDKVGEMDYELESTFQTGKSGGQDHFAHFQHMDLGYTFNLPWSPRLLFHYDYVSGDKNPNNNDDQRFDTLFGARRWEYMPTGIIGPFFRTNFQGGGWRIIVKPAEDWIIQLKQRFWWLAQSKDSFGNSGLQDPSGNSGKNLGNDVEFRVQWVLNKNLNFDFGYWHWFKGSYFDNLPASANLPPGGDKDSDAFYLTMTVRL